MSRVVVTGIGCVSAAGVGTAALDAALHDRQPLGSTESVDTMRGRRREMRLARVPAFDREEFLPARRLRRMGDLSQVWTIACLAAHADAGFGTEPSATACPPEQRGTFLGTGFGCIGTTWEYLQGLFRDGSGMASPSLFSESVANAPAGHSAIELDTRGASVTFTCGDGSAAAAVAAGARAIRNGRVKLAYCGGVEMLSPPLLSVLASVGTAPFVGEGCACLVLESRESALARGARAYAEVAGTASGADPACPLTTWSSDSSSMAGVLRRAVEQSGEAAIEKVFLHACGAPEAEEAERHAAALVCPAAEMFRTSDVVGSFAAAGGLNLARACVETSRSRHGALVSASSWGGGVLAIALRRDSA